MRHALTIALAVASTAAFVHCAATGDEADAPAAVPEAGSQETGTADVATVPESEGGSPRDAGVTAHCSPDHWCRTTLPKPDFDLRSVWSFAPDDALAVGDTGMVHWDGKTWSLVAVDGGSLDGLSSLWASGPNDVWAVAQGQRRLVHGTRAAPGGAFTWTTSETDGGPTLDTVTGASPGELWTTGIEDDGTPMLGHGLSQDGGVPSFTKVAIPDNPFSLSGLFVSSDGELWVAGTSDAAVVLHAKKKLNTFAWDTSLTTAGQPFTDFPAIWGTAPDDLWVLGAKADHYHRGPSADGGAWTPVPNHVTVAMTSVWGSGKNDVYAVGYFGAIRHWDGTTWSVSQIAVNGTPIYEPLSHVHGSSAADVWAVGPGIALHRTPGGGP